MSTSYVISVLCKHYPLIDPPFFRLIINRLERDRPFIKTVDRFSFKEAMRSASSPHIIVFFFMAFIHSTMDSGLSLFLPSIVEGLGFSRNVTQLLSAGPFAAGSVGEDCSNVIFPFRIVHFLFLQLLYSPHSCRTVPNQEVLQRPLSPCSPSSVFLFISVMFSV